MKHIEKKFLLLFAIITIIVCGCSFHTESNGIGNIAFVFDEIVNTEKETEINTYSVNENGLHVIILDVDFGIYSIGINFQKLIQETFEIENVQKQNKSLVLYLTDEEYKILTDKINNFKVDGINRVGNAFYIDEDFNSNFNNNLSISLIVSQLESRINNKTWDVYIYGKDKNEPLYHFGDNVKDHLL